MLAAVVEVLVVDGVSVRRDWRRWAALAGVVVCVGVVVLVVVSLFVPVGGRAGVILEPGDAPSAWRMGVSRGVAWYRREEPPLFRGQKLMWTPTLLGWDPFGEWHRDLPWWKVTGTRREAPGMMVEWSVPVWPAAVVALGWLGWVVVGAVRVKRRARAGRCVACGYVLGVGGACPECGRGK